jgi:hypothetical protein
MVASSLGRWVAYGCKSCQVKRKKLPVSNLGEKTGVRHQELPGSDSEGGFEKGHREELPESPRMQVLVWVPS